MAYVKSKDIQLFPSAFRGQYEETGTSTVFNPGSRLTTEYNLTSLSARASRFHQSYVVRYDKTSNDKNIILSILGYHFALKMSEYLSSDFADASNIWVKIKLEGEAEDNTNTQETKPILKPLNGGTILDEGTETGEFFGIELSKTEPSSALGEYKLHILEKTGGLWDVPAKSYFRMSAKEISDATTTDKSIDKVFTTEKLVATKINNVTIATTGTGASGTLTITDGKELKVQGDITLVGTGTATLDKNLTVGGTHNITLETAGANRTLKVSGNNKELAGAGSVITVGGNLTTKGAFDTTFIQGADVSLTLPTTNQTLATIAGTENLTNKTLTSPTLITPTLGVATATKINGLTIDTTTGTLDIANSKTLAVNESITLKADQARALTINGSNKTLAGNGSTLTLGNTLTTGAHATTLTTTGSTSITLPTTGTLATIAGTENLINKTINGLTINTTTGTLDIANDKTLTISDSTTLATNVITLGSGRTLTAQYASLEIGASGKTGKITVQSDDAKARTLTLKGNPIIGALELLNESTGFTIAGGTTSKTLTVSETYTLGPSCEKSFNDSTSASALSSSGQNLVTERDVYYGLPTINNKHDYTSSTAIYAPTSAGNAGQLLVATGSSKAPAWTSPSYITVGTATDATNATNTAFTNAQWDHLPIDGTLPDSVVDETLEIGVLFNDPSYGGQSRYYNFGIITLWPLPASDDAEWCVGTIYVGSTQYSLIIRDQRRAVYFYSGTSRITDSNYELHYRIIT